MSVNAQPESNANPPKLFEISHKMTGKKRKTWNGYAEKRFPLILDESKTNPLTWYKPAQNTPKLLSHVARKIIEYITF